MTGVVTYQNPGGSTRVTLCEPCAGVLATAGQWPRDHQGAELCQVHHGQRPGQCDRCEGLWSPLVGGLLP